MMRGLLSVVAAATATGAEVMTKFSLRNLSGGSIGLWWLEPNTKRMIPQTSVAIRNSSSLEINSYRGHEFAVRRLPRKANVTEGTWEEGEEESKLVIGSTNDVVVVDGELGLTRLDAKWEIARVLAEGSEDAASSVAEVLGRWYDAWRSEERLRLEMASEMTSLGKDADPPVVPPGGWPGLERPTPASVADLVRQECGSEEDQEHSLTLLREAWTTEGVLSSQCAAEEEECASLSSSDLLAAARAGDAHEWCERWARSGECDANPNYMLTACRLNCALWEARPRREENCLLRVTAEEGNKLKGAVSAEQNAKSQFAEGLRNETCQRVRPQSGGVGPHSGLDPVTILNGSLRAQPLFRGDLLGLPFANISLLQKFATPDECSAVVDAARPRLQRATVNEEGDPTAVSESRRAQAANVEPRDLANTSDPIARLWNRAFDVANALTGYDLDPRGQEFFSVIYYNGSSQTTRPDEYRPHCDGSCDGSPHVHGGRVATMLLYCETASEGGATTFTQARTVAAPEPTDAVFFSYYNARTGNMDTGLTTHSGCPVRGGDKWVITLWMRKGISQHDTWSKYDPTGARHEY
mmetsp:Transcript_8871/g.27296  ORF Transcript_8871/g.27296 Transcript_8871/m.27296 type:complete len:582 (+) Transcript_8871:48-1793(+)